MSQMPKVLRVPQPQPRLSAAAALASTVLAVSTILLRLVLIAETYKSCMIMICIIGCTL